MLQRSALQLGCTQALCERRRLSPCCCQLSRGLTRSSGRDAALRCQARHRRRSILAGGISSRGCGGAFLRPCRQVLAAYVLAVMNGEFSIWVKSCCRAAPDLRMLLLLLPHM